MKYAPSEYIKQRKANGVLAKLPHLASIVRDLRMQHCSVYVDWGDNESIYVDENNVRLAVQEAEVSKLHVYFAGGPRIGTILVVPGNRDGMEYLADWSYPKKDNLVDTVIQKYF